MIVPLPLLESLASASFLISPRFKVIDTCDKKQLVCLLGDDIPIHEESGVVHESAGSIFNSYTEWEALINHVHVFDNVKKRYQKPVKAISIAISQNLLRSLMQQFPERTFVVFLDLNYKDSVTIRFHQIWQGEELYYDPKYLQAEYESGRLIMFS